MVKCLMGGYSVSVKKACRCVRLHRSAWYYRAHPDLQTELRQRVREIAHARVRFGYRRILMLLRRDGWDLGKNRLYRVYREEGLGLRKKRPWRDVPAAHREERLPSAGPNDVWGVDFVADPLADGRKIRTLTIVDLYTRECLDIDIGFSLRAGDVVRAMNIVKVERWLPLRMYYGSEFPEGKWTYGRTLTRSLSTSVAAASQPTLRSWRPSMDGSERNA
jgi:putative transposase